jgi:hypothetical protein
MTAAIQLPNLYKYRLVPEIVLHNVYKYRLVPEIMSFSAFCAGHGQYIGNYIDT